MAVVTLSKRSIRLHTKVLRVLISTCACLLLLWTEAIGQRASAGLIIKFRSVPAQVSQSTQRAIQSIAGVELRAEHRFLTSVGSKERSVSALAVSGLDRVLILPAAKVDSSVLFQLRALPEVEYVQPNYLYRIDALEPPNDPRLAEQWYLATLQVQKAWAITTGDSSVTVGVIDTGVDWLHPDLHTQFQVNRAEDRNANGLFDAWSSTTQDTDAVGKFVFGDLDGIDQDRNEYVDDVIGFDFVDQITLNFGDARDRDAQPRDEHGHGTLVSGVIAARQNNNEGISGIAPGCRLLALRAFDATGNAEDDDISSAIVYAAENGVKILNLSFGDFVPSMLQRDAIRYAVSRGVTVFASSGNEGGFDRHYPSDFDEVISVGATSIPPYEDALASLTTYGESMDVVAPGEGVFTTAMNGKYQAVSGTSFSSPIAAAVGALLLSNNPTYTPAQVRGVLTSTTRDLGRNGYDPETANGRVDALQAVAYPGSATIKINGPRTNDGFQVGKLVTIRGTAVSTLFTRFELSVAKALDPRKRLPTDDQREWIVLRTSTAQVLDGSLGEWNTAGLEPGLYTLRLAVTSSDLRTTEERINIHLNSAPPVLTFFTVDTIFVNESRGLLLRARTDQVTRATLLYRSGDEYQAVKSDDRLTRTHAVLLTDRDLPMGSDVELVLRMTNTSGDTLAVRRTVGMLADAIPQRGFDLKPYALPPGYALDSVFSTPAGDHVIMSRFPDGVNFGPLEAYRFDASKAFVKADSVNEVWIPRGLGSTQSSGAQELLVQVDRFSALYRLMPTSDPVGSQLRRFGTDNEFWGAALADLNGDGLKDVIGKTSARFNQTLEDVYDVLTYTGSDYTLLARGRNPSSTAEGQSSNRYTEPNVAVADLDDDGREEIVTVDNDADIVVFAFQPGNTELGVRLRIEEEGSSEGSLVTTGDFNGDGKADIAYAYHSVFDLNADREYDPAFWTVKVLLNTPTGFVEAFRDNFYFARPLTPYRSSVRSVNDVTGDGKEDLSLSLFPNQYLISLDHGSLQPVWHYPISITARGGMSYDFDRNGIREFGFVAGDSIRFFERTAFVAQRTPTPAGLQVIPIDVDRVDLEWGSVAGIEQYIVLRAEEGASEFDVVASVTSNRYTDLEVENGIRYFYSLVAVDSQRQIVESIPAFTVSGLVHPRPRIVSVSPEGSSLRVRTSEPIDAETVSGGLFLIDSLYASSTVIAGDSLLLVTPSQTLAPGSHTLQITSRELRDRYNSPFRQDEITWMLPEPTQDTHRFYIVRWRFEDSRRIHVEFNSIPSDDALDVGKFTLSPFGRLLRVYRDPTNPYALYIDLDPSTRIVALGRPFVLCVEDIHDERNTPLEATQGNCVGITLTEPDLTNVMVYPNPARHSEGEIVFGRLTAEAEIRIYTSDMRFIRTLSTTERAGGALWDMRDENGEIVPSGIYLYHASGKDDHGKEVEPQTSKFVIIADR